MARTCEQMVAEATGRIENLDPPEVAAEIGARGVVLVDVRSAAARAEDGAIAGSVHSDRGFIEFAADPTSEYHQSELDPSARTILYCGGGGQSALAAATLQDMGYSNVAHLAGGLAAWTAAGRPVSAAEG
ncbi:MAG: rhodanese-like domain-containing protein [Thermoleophilia bacterium]|nr:rhodanese-like domain-containing protein [Thermoleophilia bacterium]MDH3725580.1 rhodanese-like domain-containing protein [Thermoleophilia bacterium]